MPSSLVEIMTALGEQIEQRLGGSVDPLIENLQVVPMLWASPTPPAIDIYPGDPFQEGIAFGRGNNAIFLTVRARVDTPDNEGAQQMLLGLMDPSADESLALAVLSDRHLGGTISDLQVTGPTNYGVFQDAGGNGNWLGCTWTVQVLP